MEGLLLALFLLFSVVTALLERRKRRQQVEEDAEARQQQHRERMGTAPAVEEEEEDEELEGWPFPSGDPFDPQQPQPARRPAPTDSMPPATEDAQTLQAEIERQARAAEKRAQAQEAEARARARQAREVRPARRLAALIGWEVESRPPPSSIAAEQSTQVRRLTEFTRRGFVVRRKGLRLLDLGSATHVTEQGGTLSTSGTSDIARPSGSDISVLTQPIPLPGLPGCCIGVSVLLMPSNRDKLRRTRDGRYEVGVYIEKDKYARYVAKVLVAYEREGVSQVAMTMPPAPNFDLAAKAGHSWALEHIPAIYKFSPEDLVVTLLDGPEFEKVRMS